MSRVGVESHGQVALTPSDLLAENTFCGFKLTTYYTIEHHWISGSRSKLFPGFVKFVLIIQYG